MIRQMIFWLLLVIGLCLLILIVLLSIRCVRRVHFSRLRTRLDRLERELWEDIAEGSGRARAVASLIARARFIAWRTKTFPDRNLPSHLLDDFEKDLAGLRNNLNVFSGKTGPILKGYVSEIDGTLQTYSVNVPENYIGDRPLPLLVHLHGHAWFAPFQEHPAPDYRGAITLAPHGRGPTDYLYIGELDVERAISEVKQDYLIDESRIYLSGTSMGGTGCWNLAVHHPDVFAGIAPRAANADYHAWENRWNWNVPGEGAHTKLRRFLRDLDNPLTYARNLRAMPICCLHNTADEVVPVEHARAMVDAVRSAGADCRYLEFLSGGHGGFDKLVVDQQLAWVVSHPPRRMQRVSFVTGRLRHGRVSWVRIDGFTEPLKLARVLAEPTDDGGIHVDCENVSALTLTPPDVENAVTVTINGQKLTSVPVGNDGALQLHLRNNRWTLGPPDETTLRKRPGIEGPVDEVFLAPFLLVYGTQGEGEEENSVVADEARRFAREWDRRFGGLPRLCADSEVSDEDIDRFNLVLFGRPDQNSILKRFADGLPIKMQKGSVEAFGKTYLGDDVGTIFCFPNPAADKRMLVVYAASGPPGYYQIHTRFGKWFNWGVFDFRKWFDYAVFDARTREVESFLKVGFFDTHWRYDPEFSFDGVDAIREEAPPQGFPKYARIPENEEVVYLSDLRAIEIHQMRGAIGLDRSFRGEPIVIASRTYQRGLGVRVPSTLQYDIDGQFRTFRAIVGLSDEKRQPVGAVRRKREAVNFIVVGDGKALWESDVIDWENPVVELTVSIRGVKQLELRVKAAGGALWLHGSTAWADARLLRN